MPPLITGQPSPYYEQPLARFVADVNVGKLGKWLRILGYDTLFFNPADDNALLRVAQQEGRVLLTRDTGLARRRAVRRGLVRAVLLESDDWRHQVRQLARDLGLSPVPDTFSRCVRCNTVLLPAERGSVAGLVPPYVFATKDRFMVCPDCSRIYWRGTHWDRVREEIDLLVGGNCV